MATINVQAQKHDQWWPWSPWFSYLYWTSPKLKHKVERPRSKTEPAMSQKSVEAVQPSQMELTAQPQLGQR